MLTSYKLPDLNLCLSNLNSEEEQIEVFLENCLLKDLDQFSIEEDAYMFCRLVSVLSSKSNYEDVNYLFEITSEVLVEVYFKSNQKISEQIPTANLIKIIGIQSKFKRGNKSTYLRFDLLFEVADNSE